MNQTMNRNKRVNRKKICSLITDIDGLDYEKQSTLEGMKHDFFAHLADVRCDRNDRQRRAVNAIRQQFQSMLSQIPSNIQNLTLEEISAKGGGLGLVDDEKDGPMFAIRIPKSVINSNATELPQVMPHLKKANSAFKEPSLLKTSVLKNMSNNKKTVKDSRVLTRSALKGHTTREVLTTTRDKAQEATPHPTNASKASSSAKSRHDNKSDTLLNVLPQLKTPRMPASDEEVITICFSTAGTPLIVQPKTTERINKSH